MAAYAEHTTGEGNVSNEELCPTLGLQDVGGVCGMCLWKEQTRLSDFWLCNQQEKTFSGVDLSHNLLFRSHGFVQSETLTLQGVFCDCAAASSKLFIQPLIEDEKPARETGAVLSAEVVISLFPYWDRAI